MKGTDQFKEALGIDLKKSRPHQIKKALGLDRYTMEDFWASCPHSKQEILSGTRKAEIRSWRQVGMVWGRLCGMSSAAAGDAMGGKDHATVLHSENLVITTLQDPRYGDPLIREALNAIESHISLYIMETDDVNVNEAACLALLDRLMGEKLANQQK